MINIWFKFEGKIQNTSKVIVFTRNHTDDDDTDDDDDDGTKNNMSPPGWGGGDIINPECLFKLTFNLRYNNHNKQVYYINNRRF